MSGCLYSWLYFYQVPTCVYDGGLWGWVVDLYTKYMAFHRPMLFILIYFYTPSMLLNNVRSEESNRHRETERDTSQASSHRFLSACLVLWITEPVNQGTANWPPAVYIQVLILLHINNSTEAFPGTSVSLFSLFFYPPQQEQTTKR